MEENHRLDKGHCGQQHATFGTSLISLNRLRKHHLTTALALPRPQITAGIYQTLTFLTLTSFPTVNYQAYSDRLFKLFSQMACAQSIYEGVKKKPDIITLDWKQFTILGPWDQSPPYQNK